MIAPLRHRVDANGVGLSVLELGAADAPPLVMLHGMRDVAASLLPIAEPLAARYRVILPELRGHGDSDQAGGYTFEQYLFDLHKVMDTLELPDAHFFGHSLGGQILVRFAAVFPARVRTAILVEGLGPPERPGENDERFWLAGYGQHLLGVLGMPRRQRPLPDLEFAARRLLANNPRLAPERAGELAELATRVNAAGERVWTFDPLVGSVFVARTRRADTEVFWRHTRCPTLIVSGDLAYEYWGSQLGLEWDGRFAPGELEARVRSFPNAEHVALAGAGHMVHFDQPEALTRATRDFLERHR
ncbi:MAG: alpha/beta hydrolase [Pseudomonadales bacterium]|nr:alpha/beta hydrolase [Pseudomonadales bacterium]